MPVRNKSSCIRLPLSNHIGFLGPKLVSHVLASGIRMSEVFLRGCCGQWDVSYWDSGQNWANLIKPEDSLIRCVPSGYFLTTAIKKIHLHVQTVAWVFELVFRVFWEDAVD